MEETHISQTKGTDVVFSKLAKMTENIPVHSCYPVAVGTVAGAFTSTQTQKFVAERISVTPKP